MLATTKDQKFKANLIRTILDYEVHQQERAETNKAARRKRAENTELAELRSKVAELLLTLFLRTIPGQRKYLICGHALRKQMAFLLGPLPFLEVFKLW